MNGPVVTAVETAPVSLAAHPELVVHGAKGGHERSDFLLVRVTVSGEGRTEVGYGEVSATPLWSGEDGTTAQHLIRTVLAPALVGQQLVPVGALDARMDRALAANPFTRSGVSIALWDGWARWLGLPLATVLGGPYRTEVPIKLSLSGDGDVLRRTHAAAVRAGFRAFKVKVGLGVAGDVARVAAVRELVGPEAFVGVDANGGWSRAEAARAVTLLAPYDVAFVEQPCAASDVDGLRMTRALGVQVVADESVFDLADLARVVRADAADVVSVYVGKAGGPGRAVELAATAHAFGIRSLIGSNGELGIGAAAQLHVACAIPHLATDLPSDVIGAHYYAEDVLAERLDSDGRRARMHDRPGLGVVPRREIAERFC
ncbi:mandelate racemase/muconate lactonizing enzyme family protein [Pseudonocardia sp. TRM90224]|uniref:mandelate racemase/muconate lactonizing enzyme family protein n=1 Tax=Pseudonocardia sp. TRM90224 TaxID=2812678 RepID=UPI001E65E07F|nr:enolase C-terminal domain-like protein [Pseudonocardia sp. TRM90224]